MELRTQGRGRGVHPTLPEDVWRSVYLEWCTSADAFAWQSAYVWDGAILDRDHYVGVTTRLRECVAWTKPWRGLDGTGSASEASGVRGLPRYVFATVPSSLRCIMLPEFMSQPHPLSLDAFLDTLFSNRSRDRVQICFYRVE